MRAAPGVLFPGVLPGRGRVLPTDPGAAALAVAVPGVCAPGVGAVGGVKWSSSECLICLFAVSMQVTRELGAGRSSSTGCSQAGLGCSGQSRAGSGMCWALGSRGVPSAVPPSPPPSGNPHHRPCTAPRSLGEHEEQSQPRNPPDFRLMEKIAPSSSDHLISST